MQELVSFFLSLGKFLPFLTTGFSSYAGIGLSSSFFGYYEPFFFIGMEIVGTNESESWPLGCLVTLFLSSKEYALI